MRACSSLKTIEGWRYNFLGCTLNNKERENLINSHVDYNEGFTETNTSSLSTKIYSGRQKSSQISFDCETKPVIYVLSFQKMLSEEIQKYYQSKTIEIKELKQPK